MAKKTKPKSKKVWTPELVFADWQKSVKSGLGRKKKLGQAILTFYEPKLLKSIEKRLKTHDYNVEGAATREVAKTVGVFSAVLTSGTEVSKGVFDLVFAACQLHPRCPSDGSGAGKWCDI